MGIIEDLGLDFVANERRWLHAIRSAAEGWYNELTDPIMPLLIGDVSQRSSKKRRRELKEIGREMHRQKLRVNSGTVLNNLLSELSKSSGIPLFSGRKTLRRRIERYLHSGDFLKSIAHSNLDSDDETASAESIARIKKMWKIFHKERINLVTQVNKQLAKLGQSG